MSTVDFASTFLTWAGVDVSNDPTLDGIDASPMMAGEVQRVRESVYGEIGYSRAVRKGDWKYIALRPSAYLDNMPLAERRAILTRWFDRRDRLNLPRGPNQPTDPFPHIIDMPGGADNTWPAIKKYPAYWEKDQLYNLADDPDEQRNLAGDPAYAPVLDDMKEELGRYLASMPGTYGE